MKKHSLFGRASIVSGGDTWLDSAERSMMSEAAAHHPDG